MSGWGAKQVVIAVVFTSTVCVGVVGAVWWQLRDAGMSLVPTAAPAGQNPDAPGWLQAPPPGAYVVLPPWPAPESLPLVGGEGTDAFGYPLQRVDSIGLQAQLRLRRFDELERHLAAIDAAYREDARKERWLADAKDAFRSSDPRLTEPLDAWVQARPDFAGALLARAAHRQALAWRHRGAGFENTVSDEQRASFQRILQGARADYEAGAARDAFNVQAWLGLYSVAREQGDVAAAASALARAKLECPHCLTPYETEMRFLAPRWGGSYAAMDALVRTAREHLADNPALALLAGFADADRCAVATRAQEHERALSACNEALAVGEHAYFFNTRADLYLGMGRYSEALADADATLRLKPQSDLGLHARYMALAALDDPERAVEAATTFLYLDPASARAHDVASHAAQCLAAWAHGLPRDQRARALRLLDAALMFEPNNRAAERLHTWWVYQLISPDDPERPTLEHLAARVEAEPDSYEAARDYDTALIGLRRLPEIVALWDAYIARHPADGRAYRERGGTRHHLGDHAASRADFQRGCELGDGLACRLAHD
ncbi:MAG: DUF4034 domain-containing protein [Polyangiales bacterium]